LEDRLVVVGPVDPASTIIKFEVQTVRPAEADTEIDEAAQIAEWTATGEWVSEEAAEEESVDTHLFLPVVAAR
jgi:hypothetical protein